MPNPDAGYLPVLSSREGYIDFLEGHALPSEDDLPLQKLTRTLVKSYMLETVRHGTPMPELTDAMPTHVWLHQLDDSMFRVHDKSLGAIVGLLEIFDTRHPVFYTTMAVQDSDRWVRHVVDANPWLDRLWLSSPILFQLWQYVQQTTPAHRYIQLGFEHEAWYESPSDSAWTGPHLEDGSDDDVNEEDDRGTRLVERRRSRVQLTERMAVLQQQLPDLTEIYDPLHSLVKLQIPSGGRGGHLLHFDGKATNRSDSFVEHRSTVAQVLNLYKRVTEYAEDRLWVDTETVGEDGFRINGAPLHIRFGERLSESTFSRFVDLGLQRKTSRFRIGGYVTRRGPTKVHLAAIDRHLWQPMLMEVTDRHITAILPRGTCGNTVHRLVTNVQRFLDPHIDVWLGGQSYELAVAESMRPAA